MADDEDDARRSDHRIAETVLRRLQVLDHPRRWQAHVEHGHLVLCDDFDDPVQQHLASIIAIAVPGVSSIETHLRSTCPHHHRGRLAGPAH
ncbi:hypothetical protein [Actinomycetospora lemnae]|uniref:BON domain-containing protein n=1 Tax=Actinomycetospora lemnae TaxID=3019891 RepID=A0ABT5SZ57_9PSEU|nr:hypothetical protein [Actinomycetospora sp. DW7H6]MDD7968001.1 hypothetical protein [Actinomycetospora sp. DW7H6]